MAQGEEATQEIDEAALGEVTLLVKADSRDERQMKLEHGASLLRIVEVIARERDLVIEEFEIFREGEVEAMALEVIIAPDYPHRRRHHIHHKSLVKVVIFYGAKEASREFKRHTTVEEVLTWAVAVKEFSIDPALAPEFELARRNVKEELPGTEHIGHLAGHATVLELDLVRGDIANG
jgi:hypothetical protein